MVNVRASYILREYAKFVNRNGKGVDLSKIDIKFEGQKIKLSDLWDRTPGKVIKQGQISDIADVFGRVGLPPQYILYSRRYRFPYVSFRPEIDLDRYNKYILSHKGVKPESTLPSVVKHLFAQGWAELCSNKGELFYFFLNRPEILDYHITKDVFLSCYNKNGLAGYMEFSLNGEMEVSQLMSHSSLPYTEVAIRSFQSDSYKGIGTSMMAIGFYFSNIYGVRTFICNDVSENAIPFYDKLGPTARDYIGYLRYFYDINSPKKFPRIRISQK